MAEQIDSEKWREIRQIQKEHVDFYKLLGAGLLILIGVFIGRATYPGQEWAFGMNLTTEVVGIAATVGIIEWFNQRRALRQYQQQLVNDAASWSHEIAMNAVHQISRKGWLDGEKSLLAGSDLSSANLRGLHLFCVNLQGANLEGAYLQYAQLWEANLQEANLSLARLYNTNLTEANLQGANLDTANLQDASLLFANLQGANLDTANLQGANLSGASLQGANLLNASLQGAWWHFPNFDTSTLLPDGDYWTADTDMKRFTDPEHPNFWQSDRPFWRPVQEKQVEPMNPSN